MTTSRGFVVACASLALVAGCGSDFYIQGVVTPPSGATCTLPSTSTPLLSEGTLDVAVRERYVAHVLLANEGGRVHIEGFIVEVHEDSPTGALVSGPGFGNPFTAYQSVIVQAGEGTPRGLTVAALEIIPRQIGAALREQLCRVPTTPRPSNCPVPEVAPNSRRLSVRLIPFGSGDDAPVFDFPLTVCCRCLLRFPPDADTTEHAGPDCLGNRDRAAPSCAPGQDLPFDCRVCAVEMPGACQPQGYRFNPAMACL